MGNPHNDADRPGRDPDGEKYGGIRDVYAGGDMPTWPGGGGWGRLNDRNDPMRERRNRPQNAED